MTTAQLIVTLMSPSVAPTHVIATPTAYTTSMYVHKTLYTYIS